jgi:hypothetical protein
MPRKRTTKRTPRKKAPRTTHGHALPLRHALATLAYRAAKPLRDAPPDFSSFRAAEGSRSPGEILAHLCDLMDWALTLARGKEKWRNSKPQAWTQDVERFFVALSAVDQQLALEATLGAPAERIFQGAIADSFTHVGQISMLRRLGGAPVRGEDYSRARIDVGRTGMDQNAAVFEF